MNLYNKYSFYTSEINIATLAISRILDFQKVPLFFDGERKESHHFINLQKSTIELISTIWKGSQTDILKKSFLINKRISRTGGRIFERKNNIAVISYNKLLDILIEHSPYNQTTKKITNQFRITSKYKKGIQVGSRKIHEFGFKLKTESCLSSFYEEIDHGWIFTFPISPSNGIIQISAFYDTPFTIKKLIKYLQGTLSKSVIDNNSIITRGSHQSSPRISSNIISDNHLNVGSGLLRFDPLCGDGTGLSIKSAILASGIILSDNSADLKIFYKSKVANIFNNHLLSCISLYSKNQLDIWANEVKIMKEVQNFISNYICDNEYLNYKIDFTEYLPKILNINNESRHGTIDMT